MLCYHSAGNVVFWYYNQRSNLQRDYQLVLKLGEITGYKVEKTEEAARYHYAEGDMPGPMGGMKDWFVQEFERPGFTIEVGSSAAENSIVSYEEYSRIWRSNRDIPICLLAEFIPNDAESLSDALAENAAGCAEQKGEAAKVQGIVQGKALNQVEYTNKVTIYDKPNGKAIASINVGSPVKVLSLAYDGWYKVLTDKYAIGYIDYQYVAIGPEYNNPLPSKYMLKGKKIIKDYITVVNQNKKTIEIYKRNNDAYEKIVQSPVSTGAVETPTPNGWFTVKSLRGEYSFIPKYQLGVPYFIQLKGGYLLHGLPMNAKRQVPKEISDALGRKDSHGCIRLPLELAKFVHAQLKEGSIVVIDNDPPAIERIISWINAAS